MKQRFRDDILHEVAHELVPKAVDQALRERGVEPIATPDVSGVDVKEGQPLTFTASFETVPPVDPGDYATIALRRYPSTVEPAAIDQALERLRQRAARYEPIDDRGLETRRHGGRGPRAAGVRTRTAPRGRRRSTRTCRSSWEPR